uniref:Bardet-Biedl syndrome 10 n=1 Tax=Sphenodon punctatus TaxID=8508 RepID=A0A8D0GQ71_SPHPU
MAPTVPVQLGRLVQEAEALAGAIRGSLGPQGGQVLLTRPTGEILLTRDGRRLLEALRLEPPTARMMIACVSMHCSVTGDGAKTFIILLSSLLRGLQAIVDKKEGSPFFENIQSRERNKNKCYRLKQISQFLMMFQARILDHIMAQYLRKHLLSVFSSYEAEIRKDTMESLLEAYFCGKIGGNNQKFLSQLSCEFFYKAVTSKNSRDEMLNLVDEYFAELHTTVTGLPVSSSRILEGLVLHRDFVVYCPANGDRRVLIVTEPICPVFSISGTAFVVNAESQYQASEIWITKRTEAVMKYLQNNNVKVLLSSVKQHEMVNYYARKSGISVVECLSTEEISLLCKITGISPVRPSWDNIHSEITETAIVKFCQTLLVGSRRYVHICLTRTCAFQPHNVILCGPVHGVTEQHASAFHGAFKMLQQLFKVVDLNTICTQTDLQKSSKICNEAATESTSAIMVPDQVNTSKDCLNEGNPIVSFKSENYRNNVQCCSNFIIQAGSVLPVGGNFEILLHYYLCHYAKQCKLPQIAAVSTVIADALLSIPELLYRTKQGNSFPRVYHKAISAIRTKQQLPTNQKGLESVSCKYQLVASVLQCAAKLLTIDMVIGIKRPLPKTEQCHPEDD